MAISFAFPPLIFAQVCDGIASRQARRLIFAMPMVAAAWPAKICRGQPLRDQPLNAAPGRNTRNGSGVPGPNITAGMAKAAPPGRALPSGKKPAHKMPLEYD